MNAITQPQPYASLIAVGAKTIETRSWSTSYRGPLVIHAGAAPPEHGLRLGAKGPITTAEYLVSYPAVPSARSTPVLLDLCNEETIPLPLGAVVASCRLVDVVPIIDGYHEQPGGVRFVAIQGDGTFLYSPGAGRCWDLAKQLPFGDFTPGRYAWLLEDVEAVTPPIPARGRSGLWSWTP